MARDAYEFEKVTCASRMSFYDLCAFHARSFYEEKFVTSFSPLNPKYVPRTCDVTYAMLLIVTLTFVSSMFD